LVTIVVGVAAGGATAIDNACGRDVTLTLSLTVTLKLKGLPVALEGLPVMAPVEEFKFSPGGSEPLTDQLL
jgi:hypothetical protein